MKTSLFLSPIVCKPPVKGRLPADNADSPPALAQGRGVFFWGAR
jgi:hypothetical protein